MYMDFYFLGFNLTYSIYCLLFVGKLDYFLDFIFPEPGSVFFLRSFYCVDCFIGVYFRNQVPFLMFQDLVLCLMSCFLVYFGFRIIFFTCYFKFRIVDYRVPLTFFLFVFLVLHGHYEKVCCFCILRSVMDDFGTRFRFLLFTLFGSVFFFINSLGFVLSCIICENYCLDLFGLDLFVDKCVLKGREKIHK